MKIVRAITAILALSVFFTTVSFAQTQTEINTQNTKQNGDEFSVISSDLKTIYQIVMMQKRRKANAVDIESNLDEVAQHNDIMGLVAKEIKAIKVRIDEINRGRKINSNISGAVSNSKLLAMLLRELKAFSRMIVVKGSSTEVNCENGGSVNLIFTGEDVNTLQSVSYIIKYNTEYLEAADLCSLTPEIEMSAEDFPVGGITSIEYDPLNGKIRFIVEKTLPQGEIWTGVINAIKFKCIKDGVTNVVTMIN